MTPVFPATRGSARRPRTARIGCPACTNGNYSTSPEESTTGRPASDPLATQNDPAKFLAGTELYEAILEDVAAVHRRIPRERMRYALEIPYIARENSTAEILALRKAWARAAG